MAHRNQFEDYRRHDRDPDHRAERERGRGAGRYGAEGPSWDDAPSSGARRDFDRTHGGPRGHAAGGDYGDYRDRGDRWAESGYRSGGYGGGYGDDFGPRARDASRHPGAYRKAETRGEYGGRRFSGQGYSAFGGDYGQRGHGGFGSGGYDEVSQTGGSAGMTGSGHSPYGYQQGGYAPGAQIWEGEGQDVSASHLSRRHEFEPDYLHWRDGQMRDLDRDYQAWRDERRQKFSREFDDWRSQRRAQVAQSPGSTLSQSDSGYGTPGASSDGDLGGTLQSNPQVTRVAGADEAAKKKN